MENETATATTNPTDAAATTTETSATLLATADGETDKQTQTAETQAVTTETPAATEAATTETKTAGAPEKYEFKAPEGTAYDPSVLESFAAAAKEANLSQEAAQKLVEKMAPAIAARQDDQVKAIRKEWQDASTADKEFGGEKLAENLGVARKALDAFGSPELRTLLDNTGLGNHPEVLRFMFRAGKAISEDKFVGGNARGTGASNPAAVLYDKTQKG